MTARAVDYYWDNTNPMSTSGFGTAGGVWGTDAFWSTSNVGTASSGTLTTGTADRMFFGTSTTGNGLATGTVGVNGTVTGGSIIVGSQSGAITLGSSVNSGTISLGAGSITVSNASVLTINSDLNLLSASPSTRNVSGRVTLNGNTTTGGILSIQSGGTLTLAGNGGLTGLAGAGTIVIAASNLTWGTVTNTGVLDLNGNNLTLGNMQSTAGAITDNSAGSGTTTLTTNGVNTSTFSGTIADGATKKVAFVHNNAGSLSLTLSAANTFSGNTRVAQASGRLTLGNNLALQNSAIDTSGSGSFLLGTGITTPTIGGLIGSKNLASVITGSYSLMTALTLNTVAGQNLTYSGTITDGAAGMTLTKTGPGMQTLSAVNTYTGATTISGGTLQIGSAGRVNSTSGVTVSGNGAELKYNSATALSQPLTLTRGTLSGTGTINTPVSIGTNVTLSPGNSPGTQTYQSGTFASGGTYAWEINNWTSGTAGVNFDQAIFTSGLAITSSSASPFTISLVSLQADNTSGAVPGFNSGLTGLSFAIATGTMTGYSPTVFTLGTSSFLTANTVSGSANGGFWLSTNSGSSQLILNYAPSARYTLSATPAATSIRTGSSTVITGAITSSTADRTGADAMAFSGLSVGTGSLSTTSGTILSGSSASGTVTYTGTAAGQFTFTPSVSATNVNLGTAARAGTVTSGTVTVWNPAVATTSGSVNLGTVIVGASSLSQALSITNSAPTDGFSEKLNASFGTLAGVTTNSGSIALLASGSTNAAAMTVGLATNTVGNLSGSAQVNFQTDGQGTSGLSAAALSPQTVNVYGTVLDHATPGFLGVLNPLTTSTLALNFGSVNETAGLQSLTFSLTNLAALAGADLTAGLALTGTGTEVGSGFSLAGAAFSNLLAGGTSGLFTVGFTPSGQGSFSQTFKLSFSDNTILAGAVARRDLFVAANVIVVPEPAALALAGIGVGLAGWMRWGRRRKHRGTERGRRSPDD